MHSGITSKRTHYMGAYIVRIPFSEYYINRQHTRYVQMCMLVCCLLNLNQPVLFRKDVTVTVRVDGVS